MTNQRSLLNRINFGIAVLVFLLSGAYTEAAMTDTTFTDGSSRAAVQTERVKGVTRYTLTTTAPLRDNEPADKTRVVFEEPGFGRIRTGSRMFDALYALTLDDARLNAVQQIRDGSFEVRPLMNRPYFQTGQQWTYVWTRDIAYSVDLGLASLDPLRCVNSLLFKTTQLKPGIEGTYRQQIVQDTGSGGSYPVSTDRAVWALGAEKLMHYLEGDRRDEFCTMIWPILRDTIEQDRRLIFDPADGLYRGEQSFLDWREQTYPGWTNDNVVAIAQSKALSTNIGHYQLLKTAAGLAEQQGLAEVRQRYQEWAAELKQDINREFYMPSTGLYSSIILDDPMTIRTNRYDLLGQSLAVLSGVADEEQSRKIIANYPQSKYGPPVVWPQEQTVPIYHNHAYWPFVTAYWLKAARQAHHAAAVNQAVYSLVRGTALNLSNMENFDIATGQPWAEVNGISGPVINSRRQLWSVAGYLAMVQDVLFGLETTRDGIRFIPCITAGLHREYFSGSEQIRLEAFEYRGRTIQVTVHLPALSPDGAGIYTIDRVALNGESIQPAFIAPEQLEKDNHWEVWLGAVEPRWSGSIHLVSALKGRHLFGPKQPQWKPIGQGGLTVENGKLKLHYDAAGETDVRFNIYRDGTLCAGGLQETEWLDPDSGDYGQHARFYAVEAFYPDTGNCSHLSPPHAYVTPGILIEYTAAAMEHTGGNLVDDHHFENWGQRDHELRVPEFTVKRSGRYLVRANYSNGAGPINTGVTCAIKRVDIIERTGGDLAASGYLIMPHTADWTRYVESSSFEAELEQDKRYSMRIYEDAFARNMSYFDHYEPYKGSGSGQSPYHYVNIAAITLLAQPH